MQLERLSHEQISERLQNLSGWQLVHEKLHKEYQFESFVSCFGFMTKVALLAEALQHHPEWFNVYNRLTVDLSTHDVGGISARDFQLAQEMDRLAP